MGKCPCVQVCECMSELHMHTYLHVCVSTVGPFSLPLSSLFSFQCLLFNDLIVFALGDRTRSTVELQLSLEAIWVTDLEDLDPQTCKGEDREGVGLVRKEAREQFG